MSDLRHWRLGIDFGSTNTVGVLLDAAGQAQTLLFDGGPLLSSAVFAQPDGRLLVGRDAARSARTDPGRFEPNPKRRIDEGTLLLGERQYQLVEVFAAVLRTVVTEAARVAGGMPSATVITCPAAWAGTRKAVLAQAAQQAGIAQVTLVPEPIAAAVYLTEVLGHRVTPGASIAVYDLGGGTCDISVLCLGAQGWQLQAFDGCDVGGLDLDDALVASLRAVLAARDPQLVQRLASPGTDGDRRAAKVFLDDVRAAKEQLSRASSAPVNVPLFDVDLHVTREEFERLARPYIERTTDMTASVLQRAGLRPDQLSALFLVGGSSRIPLVATMLHERFRMAPTVLEQPELVVAQGAALSAARAVGGQGATTVAAGHGGPGAAATPTSPRAMPPAPVFTGPAVPPPIWPAPTVVPVVAARRHHRRGRKVAAIAAIALLVCGGGGYGLWRLTRPDTRTVTGGGAGRGVGVNAGQSHGSANSPAPDLTADHGSAVIDRAVNFGGYKVTFNTATYDPAGKNTQLSVDLAVENLDAATVNNLDLPITYSEDATHLTGHLELGTTAPGRLTTKVAAQFQTLGKPVHLDRGTFTLGEASQVQAIVPVAKSANTVEVFEPRNVLRETKFQIGSLDYVVSGCEVRVASYADHKQAPAGKRILWCAFDVRPADLPKAGQFVGQESFRLKLPDGTVSGPSLLTPGGVALYPNSAAASMTAQWAVSWPAVGGQYVVQFSNLGSLGNDPVTAANTRDVAVTL